MTLFGLIYRKHLEELNISSTETSTIINTMLAVSCLIGLMNGPIFAKFTFRKIGLAGSALIFVGLFSSAWCTSTLQYIVTNSFLYGIGLGLAQDAGSLALNTFFKEKRRKATGYAYTIAGIGPLVLPHVAVFGLAYFGYIGTVLTFAGISSIAFISALCYRSALQFSKVEARKEQTEDFLESEAKENQKMENIKNFIEAMDLDLLKDKSLLNLIIGITMIIFAEINFFILVPFFLGEAGFVDQQISLLMSIFAGVDITFRFLAPFATQKVQLGNKPLFSIGISIISIGCLIIVWTNNYYVMVIAFVLLGIGKAIRTITRPLLIVEYVPLKRYPAANGLRSVLQGITYFTVGPLIGLIKQNWGNEVTVYVLNIMSTICLISWGIEGQIQRLTDRKRLNQ